MDLQAAFRARLKAIAALNTPTKGIIEWGQAPEYGTWQGARFKVELPYLVLTKVAPGRDWTHDGPIDLVQPRVQIDIYAASNPAAAALAGALQGEMERVTDVTVGGWKFLPPAMLVSDQWPGPEDLDGGGKAFRVTHDYYVWARPA